MNVVLISEVSFELVAKTFASFTITITVTITITITINELDSVNLEINNWHTNGRRFPLEFENSLYINIHLTIIYSEKLFHCKCLRQLMRNTLSGIFINIFQLIKWKPMQNDKISVFIKERSIWAKIGLMLSTSCGFWLQHKKFSSMSKETKRVEISIYISDERELWFLWKQLLAKNLSTHHIKDLVKK